MNLLQYAIPIATLAWALGAVFRQRPSRFIPQGRRSPARAPAGATA